MRIKKPKNDLSQWKQVKPKYLHLYTSSLVKDNIYNRCSVSCPFSATPNFRRQALLWQCCHVYLIQGVNKACMHFKSLPSCCGGKKLKRERKKEKKEKNIGKMKVLELTLFIHLYMWMLLWYTSSTWTHWHVQTIRHVEPSSRGQGKQLSQGGDKFKADFRMAGESMSGIVILHPRKDSLFFQETSMI